MRTFSKIALVLLLFLSLELSAQVQYGINYQAVLRDANGSVLPDKSATIRVNITNKNGDIYYYKETHDVTTNNFGLITLIIGKGLPVEGTFANIPWSEGGISMIIEIKVSPATTFTPFEIQELHGVPYAFYSANGISGSANAGETSYFNGSNWVANGEIVVTDSSVNIVPKAGHNPEQPIFAVLNSDKQIVFAVYESGVRSYVGSNTTKKAKGGFAVGGLSGSKSDVEYLNISPDSIRIYIDNTGSKAAKGGFAVGGLSGTKSLPTNYFKVTTDSTYFKNTVLSEKDMLVAGSVTTNVGLNETPVTDIDGNIYKTVKIGTRVWMAENLKTTKYADNQVISPSDVLVYNNSLDTDTLNTYGRLYTNTAVTSGFGLCPDGWHIPTMLEWEELFMFVGGVDWQMNSMELARKLSEKGIVELSTGFWTMDFQQNNASNFSARPSGYADGTVGWIFSMMGTSASYWVDGATEVSQIYGESGGMVTITNASSPSAHSIRCVKN